VVLCAALSAVPSSGWAGAAGPAGSLATGFPFKVRVGTERDLPLPKPKHRVAMRSFERLVKPHAERQSFKGWKLVGEQHLADSTGELLRATAAAGIKPRDMLVMSDPKSANYEVIQELRNEGFQITYGPRYSAERHALVDPEQELDGILRGTDIKATARIPGGLGADPKARYVILDDGGKLLEYINEHFPQLKGRVVGVQQTSGGSRRLDRLKKKLWFPVVDVGRSWGKLGFESPSIARSEGNPMQRKLDSLRRRGIDAGREVVLFGYGPLGEATAKDLQSRGYTVKAYDRVLDGDGPEAAAMRARAQLNGVTTLSRADAIANGKVFLTVTGEANTITADDFERMKDGAILINGAQSGAYQVTDEMYRDPAQRAGKRFPYPTVTEFRGKRIPVGDFHSMIIGDHVIRSSSGKQFLLVNNNRAINFDPQKAHIVPPRYIQLTRGFLFLGIEQAIRALKSGKVGVQPLALKPQRKYVGQVEAELRARGESLAAPNF
jgi:S-adenosylhomocysteine hydrolase